LKLGKPPRVTMASAWMHRHQRREQLSDANFPPIPLGEGHLVGIVPAAVDVRGSCHAVNLRRETGVRCSRLHTQVLPGPGPQSSRPPMTLLMDSFKADNFVEAF
jgi:hypothetical protein